MPRKVTSRVLERKRKVYEFIKERGEVPTVVITQELGLTHSQAFYVLRILLREGKIEEVKRGKVAYWRVVEEGSA